LSIAVAFLRERRLLDKNHARRSFLVEVGGRCRLPSLAPLHDDLVLVSVEDPAMAAVTLMICFHWQEGSGRAGSNEIDKPANGALDAWTLV
jgi:hypothetical protein